MATEMSCTSCEELISPTDTSQVFRILPRNGMMACVSRSRACLAEPPAESPSTRNSSECFGSWLVQSASLPGSAGPAVTRLRLTCCAALVRSCAFSMANCAMRSPASGCWLSHSDSESCTKLSASEAASRVASRSFIWPANCGSWILIDSTKQHLSKMSSGVSLMPRGTRLRNSQNSRTAPATPARRPFTCVPPSAVGMRLT